MTWNDPGRADQIETRGAGRLASIDLWRGISMMFVISSHLFWGLYSRGKDTTFDDILSDPILFIFGMFATVAQMFFFISGCAQVLSMEKQRQKGVSTSTIVRREIKKGIVLIIVGTVYDPIVYWHFGIVDTLHAIGLSYILLPLLYKRVLDRRAAPDKERLRGAGKQFLVLAIAIILLSPAMRMIVGYPVHDPALEFLVYCRTPTNVAEYLQGWITTSFFPVFPWLAYFLFGAWHATRVGIAAREGEGAKRRLTVSTMKWGVVAIIAGIALILAGEEIAGPEILLPQYMQPDWVVELSFNVQPLTSAVFFFYLGVNLLGIGFLSRVYDLEHAPKRQALLVKVHYWFKIDLAFNTWIRFSYLSLTVYILQYAWIPVLRVAQVLTGEQFLYSIDDTIHLLAIIVVAWIGFAFLTKALNSKRGFAFTFERLLRAVAK